jgi:LysM repeat protein
MLIETHQTSQSGETTESPLAQKEDSKAKISWGKAALVGFNVALPLILAATAFSHLGGASAATGTETLLGVPTSRTPALQAAKNVDPSGRGGGDITILGGVALLPESGPQGTLSDVEAHNPSADEISIYVVREGDTLSQIAEMFGVSTNTVLWANDLKNSKDIHPGDTLVILPITGIQHVVAKGETIASIVKKYKGDMHDVLSFNNLSEGAALAVGDTVVIPDGVETVVTAPSGSARVVRSAGGPSISGYFLRPIVGGVKSQGIHGYNGVDLAAPLGTNVMASAAGTVMVARASGWNGGYGAYIVIQHGNGTQTLYAHLSDVFVSPGQSVTQGQAIGASGNSGRSTGAHLHFEVRGAANPF